MYVCVSFVCTPPRIGRSSGWLRVLVRMCVCLMRLCRRRTAQDVMDYSLLVGVDRTNGVLVLASIDFIRQVRATHTGP